VTDQAVDRIFRLGAGAPHIVQVITRMAGIAAGKFGFSLDVPGDFLQIVDNVIAIAHGVDTVFHAVFLLRVQVFHVVHLGGMFPMDSFKKLPGFAGMARLAGSRSLVAFLLDLGFSRMLCSPYAGCTYDCKQG